jgi:hypothetical protein
MKNIFHIFCLGTFIKSDILPDFSQKKLCLFEFFYILDMIYNGLWILLKKKNETFIMMSLLMDFSLMKNDLEHQCHNLNKIKRTNFLTLFIST